MNFKALDFDVIQRTYSLREQEVDQLKQLSSEIPFLTPELEPKLKEVAATLSAALSDKMFNATLEVVFETIQNPSFSCKLINYINVPSGKNPTNAGTQFRRKEAARIFRQVFKWGIEKDQDSGLYKEVRPAGLV